jgi:hypothetical protein
MTVLGTPGASPHPRLRQRNTNDHNDLAETLYTVEPVRCHPRGNAVSVPSDERGAAKTA